MRQVTVERLGLGDHDEMLDMLNRVFAEHNNNPAFRFQEVLPKMARPTEENMRRHFAVRENGRIVAALGVYPLPTVIAGERFLFSTVGNVGTLPEARGKGYMTLLLAEAMEELSRIGADASRLGGKQERYARYGYFPCGTAYRFLLPRQRETPPAGVSLRSIEKGDTAALEFCAALYRRNSFRVERTTPEDFYDTLTAFKCRPLLALDGAENPVGYAALSENGREVSELDADGLENFKGLVQALCAQGEITAVLPLGKREEAAYLQSLCLDRACFSPSLFYIRNWPGILNALLRWKASQCALPDASETLTIAGCGTFTLECSGGKTRCFPSSAPAQRVLTPKEAAQALLGPCPEGEDTPALFPLPLTWRGQDRV